MNITSAEKAAYSAWEITRLEREHAAFVKSSREFEQESERRLAIARAIFEDYSRLSRLANQAIQDDPIK